VSAVEWTDAEREAVHGVMYVPGFRCEPDCPMCNAILDALAPFVAARETQARDDIAARVRKVHEPVEALNVRYGHTQKVCTGCGTDAGNWQVWPCPTVRAIERGESS